MKKNVRNISAGKPKIKTMNNQNKKRENSQQNLSKAISLLMIVTIMASQTFAQTTDSAKIKFQKDYKNTIKINLTSFILYSSGLQLNYERLLSPKTSITVFGGYIEFPMPTIIANSPLEFDKNKSKGGFSLGSEYRFYLAKENKYAAPHGVYLAPFVSYYHFTNTRTGRDTTDPQNQLSMTSNFDFLNIGGELGYQFVIKNRFVIDCVLFGPAVSSYYFSVKLNGSTSGNNNEHVQAIIDALKDKYPILKDLSNGEKVSTSGVSSFWSLGFRYAIHIGYRF
jgi:hypothetical protein